MDKKEIKEENIVKKTCKELGITQKELAVLMGVNDGTIRKWSSQTKPPEWGIAFLNTILKNKDLNEKLNKFYSAFALVQERASQNATPFTCSS